MKAHLAPMMADCGATDIHEFGSGLADMETGEDMPIITMAEQLQMIEESGLWGYISLFDSTIHVWAKPETDPAELMHFLGHEFGHEVIHANEPDLEDHIIEQKAEEFGLVAKQAYELLQEFLKLPA